MLAHIIFRQDFSQETTYRSALTDFDNWVLDRLGQYPEVIQTCIPAAYQIYSQHFLNSTVPFFSIIMGRRSDSRSVRSLDKTVFAFEEQDTFEPLAGLFSDPARSGTYFPTETSFKRLAKEIVENVCPK